MELIQDFKEFLELLNKNEVVYMVIGGYAVIVYGYPRLTIDIDIWVNPNIDNSRKVIKSIEEFGFSFDNLTEEDFKIPDNVIQLGRAPNRIDILTSTEGLSFEECYKNKFEYEKNNLKINFIGLDDLKKNKKLVGRYKDLDDLKNLK